MRSDHGNPGAGANRVIPPGPGEGQGTDCAHDLFGDCLAVGDGAIFQDDGELVATDAGRQIMAAANAPDGLRDLLEQGIARGMAGRVIDRLEVIEIDKQKQAADVMEAAFERIGMDMVHIIGPKTAHTIHRDSATEIERRLTSLAERGRERFPQTVQFVTYTLKYNRMHWVTVDALEQHWERAFVRASCPGEARDVEITTENVTAMTLDFPAGWCPLDLQSDVTMNIDGNRLTAPRPMSDRSWRCELYKDETGRWRIGTRPATGLAKKHNLQGPIDDALMDSFLFVAPNGTSSHASVEAWTQAELKHAIGHWRQQMRGDVRIKQADEVTEEDIARHNLILWGDAESNELIARVLKELPVRWTADSVGIGDEEFDAATHVPAMIYPNPLNPERYVVLNSSFTYREYDYLNNARQVPKLPDWAIIDISEGADSRWPGRVRDADFFDESWQVRPAMMVEAPQ